MAKRRKQYEARIYLGRDASGKQRFHYIGRYERKRDRDRAVQKARADRDARAARAFIPLCGEYVDRYLAEYEELHKDSSLIAACRGLKRFREDFADRSLDISRTELKDWMNGEGIWAHRPAVPRGYRPAIVALYNHAIDEDDVALARSPARGLGRRSRSERSQLAPPTRAAHYHAALSTRLILKGVADRCFAPRDEPCVDRFGKPHKVLDEHVGNRIAAFVDLEAGHSDEEHQSFATNLETLTRWAGRGPHRIYPNEAQRYFLRLLDALGVVAVAYFQAAQSV